MAINLRFHMEKKNDYNFIVFLDQTGRAEVGRELLLEWARADEDAFPMDYVDLAAGYAGRITVEPLGSGGLDRALLAYAIYTKMLAYPAGYLAALRRAHRFAESKDACSIFVQRRAGARAGRNKFGLTLKIKPLGCVQVDIEIY